MPVHLLFSMTASHFRVTYKSVHIIIRHLVCHLSQQWFCLILTAVSVTLSGITKRLMDRLQSVLNEAARLVCNSRNYDHISPLLRELHWLCVPERIKFYLAILVFCCHNQTASEYLARELQWAVEVELWRPASALSQEAGHTPNATPEQLVTVPLVLLRLVYGTACQPTLSLLSHWQLSRALENIFVQTVVWPLKQVGLEMTLQGAESTATGRLAQHCSSGAVVTVQRVRHRLQIFRLTYLLTYHWHPLSLCRLSLKPPGLWQAEYCHV